MFRRTYRFFAKIPPEVEVQNWRFYLVSNFANTLGLVMQLFWLIFYLVMDLPELLAVTGVATLIMGINAGLIRRNQLYLAAVLVVVVLVGQFSFVTRYLGLGLEFQYYILLIAIFPLNISGAHSWLKYVLFTVCLGAFIGVEFLFDAAVPIVDLKSEVAFGIRIFNMTSSFIALGIYAIFYNYAINRTDDRLEEMYEEAESLLHNILPQPIAEELKEDPHAIATKYPAVSVVFADLVGFTQLSTRMKPIELVNLLNDIFSRFDDLAEKHGMEKIKTIGDAYMVVAGLPKVVADHAPRSARMALDMLEEVKVFNLAEDTRLAIRVGIASGEVVAGVIGKKKFSYDLWGDTVNTASRMESHGLPDKIQVCASTHHLLRDEFELEERGTIEVKGKGAMRTWFLLRPVENGAAFP